MIKVTVNKDKVAIELNGKKEVVLAEIVMVMHEMGDCLHVFHTKYNLPDEAFEFTKKAALLAFVDGCNGTDPEERYTHDGN